MSFIKFKENVRESRKVVCRDVLPNIIGTSNKYGNESFLHFPSNMVRTTLLVQAIFINWACHVLRFFG